jgi:catechol 2,3-dioxygenase-like lactoylglutathione lyase family enzyme
VVVSDMKKAKEFYAEKLGLEVATDYRQNDDNWWVTLTLPSGGASITLARSSTTSNEPPNPGTGVRTMSTFLPPLKRPKGLFRKG